MAGVTSTLDGYFTKPPLLTSPGPYNAVGPSSVAAAGWILLALQDVPTTEQPAANP